MGPATDPSRGWGRPIGQFSLIAVRGPAGAPPATRDAYLYSPAFAQLIWPLAQLPWPVFGTVWAIGSVAILWWLVRVCDWYVAIPLFLVGAHEMLTGNVNALLALVVVFGLRHPVLWALPLLTKVTPCIGPIWFLVRGEWRSLGASVAAIGVVAGASWLASPELWVAWVSFLGDHVGRADQQVGGAFLPPLLVRLPVAVVLTAWGARTDRVWTIPTAMFLLSPVAGPGQFVLFMTIPRLLRVDRKAEPLTRRSRMRIPSTS